MESATAFDIRACLEAVREGDDAAARELVDQHYGLVIRIVRSHRPRRMAEEDLAQEIFIKMFTRLEQYRGEMPFAHWLSRVAVTTCYDALRAQRRRPELRMGDLTEAEADALHNTSAEVNEPAADEAVAARELVGKLLDTLGAEDRMVVTLLDLEQRSVAEIAKLTGWSESAVKVRAHRARKKLRKQIEILDN